MKGNRKFVHFYRKIYSYVNGFRLKNKPTIISRDCIGGVLYNDYNLPFLSPTINLEFSNKDFFLFCNYLDEFLNTDMVDISSENFEYPVGLLRNKYGDVTVYFRHYDNFETALSCWERRKKRVDYKNIYIIMCIGPNGDKKTIEDFEKLNYKHKILLSSNINVEKYPNCFNMKCYENGYKDSLIQHISKYSCKRFLNEFNWLKFFDEV